MANRQASVLVIDSDLSVAGSLQVFLNELGFELRSSTSAAAGIAAVHERAPSLILLAVNLPDRSGVELFKEIRGRARTAHIPIMFVADPGESRSQNAVLTAGADDFIAKPFDSQLLALRIRNAIQRTERDGVVNPRSGLPTGRLLTERIRSLADEYNWYKIDLTIDHFDAFTSHYGFMTGDEVLVFTAALLNDVVKAAGTPDDFVGQRDDTTFSIITTLEKGPALRTLLEQRFNTEVGSFYTFTEREQGFIEVDGDIDPLGISARKPLMQARIKVQEGEAD